MHSHPALRSSADIRAALARQVRIRRKRLKLSRRLLAERSAVPAATIKRFETTSDVSLRQFLMLWRVVGKPSDFDALLDESDPDPMSIDDVATE